MGDVLDNLETVKPGFGLPGMFYFDEQIFGAELEKIWHREWVFVGVEAAFCRDGRPQIGHCEHVRVGAYELLLIRGEDLKIRALHNVCRHRGFVVCESGGQLKGRRLVCPYHQWSYSLDGQLVKARSMPEDFEVASVRLGEAHCEIVGGLIFVCVAESPPPFEPFRSMVAPYLQPFDLSSAVVAHQTETIERGNWKLVMENNRECYHCTGSHPQLSRSFPSEPFHAGNASPEDSALMDVLVERCESIGLPSRFAAAQDASYRVMRMPFRPGMESMTMSGKRAVFRRFAGLPVLGEGLDGQLTGGLDGGQSIGDVLLYHYPSTWNHFQSDHCVVFRLVPLSPVETKLITTWLVPEGSVEGRDYDRQTLTEVWEATNAQDAGLVERTQRGVSSPAFRPGRYSPAEEDGVIQFLNWYVSRLSL